MVLIERRAASSLARSPAPPPSGACAATLSTLGGTVITEGLLEVTIEPATHRWRGTLRAMGAPGSVATAYFLNGVRDVIVRLADGRAAEARMTGTTFEAFERICTVAGSEPLA